MCGIVGYVGKEQAAPILLEGLTKLEYRGYDSAGIAVRDGDSAPVTVKEKGRIADLKDKIGPVENIVGTCG
ncbi:MAG: glutamine--fructose-6-phosphate aminotransferase, partial [Clostridia bacterium]|nr:glutamine--fructose-6-phosphate aminotransferase [Clostridia bacterium]